MNTYLQRSAFEFDNVPDTEVQTFVTDTHVILDVIIKNSIMRLKLLPEQMSAVAADLQSACEQVDPATAPAPRKLMAPTLHLNGTSYDSLAEQLMNALGKLNELQAAMCNAAPHGRDYYIQPEVDGWQAIDVAKDQHYDRLSRLEAIEKELQGMLQSVIDQNLAKKR